MAKKLLLWILVMLFLAANIHATGEEFVIFANGQVAGNTGVYYETSTQCLAQNFTVHDTNASIKTVIFSSNGVVDNSTTATFNITIQTISGHMPSGTLANPNAVIDNLGVKLHWGADAGGAESPQFNFTNHFNLTDGTTYMIVLCVESGDGGDGVLNDRADGLLGRNSDGASWNIWDDRTFMKLLAINVSAGAEALSINVTYPVNHLTYNLQGGENGYQGWINVTSNKNLSNFSKAPCLINDSRWALNSSTNETCVFYNKNYLSLANGSYTINITVNGSEAGQIGNYILTFTMDITSPNAISNLTNTTITNTNITIQINYTDETELYSILNVTINDRIFYNLSGLSGTLYTLNLTIDKNNLSAGQQNVSTCVADAHTSNKLKQDWKIKRNLNALFFDDMWIYSKQIPILIEYEEQEDRYSFCFNYLYPRKKIEFMIPEYMKNIDNPKYKGWFVDETANRWLDFEGKYDIKVNGHTITAESDEATSRFCFESVGELNINCNDLGSFIYYDDTDVEYAKRSIATTTESFNISFGNLPPATNLSVNFIYNNTIYTPTATGFNYTVSLTVPTLTNSTNITFYWNYSINDEAQKNTTFYNQSIYEFLLVNCSEGYPTVRTLNFTGRDEGNSSLIVLDYTAEFDYSIGSTTKEYDFQIADSTNFSVCIYPNFATIDAEYTIYYSEADYPQRSYYESDAILTNITQLINLYSLNVGDGIYGRFRVVDGYENPIEGVECTMKQLDGTLVEQENTDGSGLATFWLDPDIYYNFTFTKSGYEPYSTKLRVTTTEIYTISLESQADEGAQPFSAGINYLFNPTQQLNNQTAYNFSFDMSSEYWNITDCSFTLKNTDGTTIATSSTTYSSSDCNITISQNTGTRSSIIGEAIYELNGTSNTTLTTQWAVIHTYTGDTSLKYLIDDITSFSKSGFNDTTRMILSLLITFLVVGGLAKQSTAFRDPEALIGLTWVMIVAFSYIGWLTLNYDPIPTAWLQQYIIAILVSLAAGAYIMKRHTD